MLLAISGGIDSMVLCDLFDEMGLQFDLAHCNFKLRDTSSDLDETFVQNEALKRNLELFTICFDTKKYAREQKLSIQMAARELRYHWFKKIVEENQFDYLVTAHHADDVLETFFINLSRGTGIDGLTGIPEHTEWIIRPLLPFSKKEIHAYASKKGLEWREDHSNEDTKYLRNKIRKELVPALKELNPNFMTSFAVTLENLEGSRQIIKDRMNEVLEEIIEPTANMKSEGLKFKVEELLNYASNSAYLYEIFHPYGFIHWKDIRSLLKAQSGKQVFSRTHRLIKHGNYLLLNSLMKKPDAAIYFEVDENQPSLDLGDAVISLETAHVENYHRNKGVHLAQFDKELLEFPLLVRKWRKGDYFHPLGMRGKKKLSDFFKDQKYSLLQKENIWLLCSGEDIIWLIGKRMDNRYKVTEKTKNILTVSLDV
jgi:tRNA(Ile)-lysidine synthase